MHIDFYYDLETQGFTHNRKDRVGVRVRNSLLKIKFANAFKKSINMTHQYAF